MCFNSQSHTNKIGSVLWPVRHIAGTYDQTKTSARASSNLRSTTRECEHSVARGHFRSRDKDGSAIPENPMLHANLMALCFIEPELWPIEVLHCGNWDIRPF